MHTSAPNIFRASSVPTRCFSSCTLIIYVYKPDVYIFRMEYNADDVNKKVAHVPTINKWDYTKLCFSLLM